ncbi:hypothetical protein [Leifsonia aquatica]|uniref:hypothetical protein n=1 Tax=Leifsonia aquatica TaxID=144185 RepID=UPI0028AA3A81|nr:hypothetical protein [Leifsonia aquatica]
MPTFDDPLADAAEASAALRGLAHATRAFDKPAETYPVIGDLLAGVRSLRQVIDQLADAHTRNESRAHGDHGDPVEGADSAAAAAGELHQASSLLDRVASHLDAASQHSGRIAWHPAAHVPDRRWVSVVFLQGQDADKILDLIARAGTDAAIEHLTGFEQGEETTRAALENGYVYDTPPTTTLDQTATRDDYTLTYNPFHGHVSLLRQYATQPDPALLAAPPSVAPQAEQAAAGPASSFARPKTRGTDWFARPPGTPVAGRGLAL